MTTSKSEVASGRDLTLRSGLIPAKRERGSVKKASNGRKLAEVVAERIENQIVRADWPVGEVIASESELLARFRVSRAVLREAIRIVENHRVARMRRGPNGGLVVTQPDALSLTRAAALLLDYEHVTGANLANARITIELAAVEDATKQLDERKVEILKAALEAETREIDTGTAQGFTISTPSLLRFQATRRCGSSSTCWSR